MKESEKYDFDQVLGEIGQFGKYQLVQYLILSLPIILDAWFGLGYIFTTGKLNYRCHIPECEDLSNTTYNPVWLNNTVPFEGNHPVICRRFEPLKNVTEEFCRKDDYDRNNQIECRSHIYEDAIEKTILNEWDITCKENEWKLTLVGTINNIGQFVCMPLAGYVSDRYGRRWVLIFGILSSGTLGLIKSFSVSYEMFITMEFLEPALGSGVYSTAFILAMELVGPSKRVLGGTIINCFYGVAEAILGLLAMYVRQWRTLLRILYLPAFLCISFFWLVPESVRWLISKGKYSRATEILKKAAKINGTQISPATLDKLHLIDKEQPQVDDYPLKEVFKSPFLLLRIANCSFCWLTNTFVYFGLSLNSVSVAGNKYVNFITVSLIEIPAFFVTYLILDRLGRRKSLCGALLCSGLACIISEFIPNDQPWLKLVMFLAGKFAITISFSILYVYTTELFPTNLRHSLLATCSMFGRIGSMVAPQTPLLARVWSPLPLILFGGTAIASGFLSLLFPETLNTKLPDTIDEAVNINKENLPK